jgi:hypothetical protein
MHDRLSVYGIHSPSRMKDQFLENGSQILAMWTRDGKNGSGRKHSGTSNNVQWGVFCLYLFAITVVKNALPFHLSVLGRLTEKSFLSCYVLPLNQ